MNRTRMTWAAAGRKASAPPATPGYNTEDQDHPAHQPDPDYAKYQKGDPDAWAETPRPYGAGYPQGNPPSLPGYDTEDQDHPAHKELPRVPKEARSMKAAVERKANKCVVLARKMLGKKASQAAIENRALDMMDWSDNRINATLERLGGGFMADFDEFAPDLDPMVDDIDLDLDLDLADGFDDGLDDLGVMLADDMKLADQNDPEGDTLAPKPKSEEQARKEAAARRARFLALQAKKAEDEEDDDGEEAPAEDEAPEAKTARKFFASMDRDRDGFIVKAEWKGSEEAWAAIDTDGDEIVTEEEVVSALAPQACGPMASDLGLTSEERKMLASLEANLVKKAGKKAEDEEDAPAASKKAKGKKAEEKEDEKEDAPAASKKSGKKAKWADDEEDEGDDEAEGDDGDEEADKTACGDAGVFGMEGDPMGLAAEDDELTADDDALLAEIFGKSASDDEEEGEGEEEVASKKAKKADEDEDEDDAEGEEEPTPEEKKAMRLASRKPTQRPQPRKASVNAVRSVGGLTRTASANTEVAELSNLWDSAPDVSKVFNG